MRKMRIQKYVGMASLLLLLGAPAYGAPAVKIGLIDTQRILQESKAAKDARALILEDIKEKRGLFSQKQDKVRALEEDLEKSGKNLGDQALKKKREDLNRELKNLQRLKADLEEELNKKNTELTQKILREVVDVVKAFTKDEKYTLILETKSVVSADETIDITDRIIKLYDKK
ncbi:MAG: OmpH family outer membrane protein, partial [Deltaproteobacteria bacterium]|nr:OmpH family outer membrane protein [Deltaproteobacteria bacterium]